MPRPEHGRLSGTPVPNRGETRMPHELGTLVVFESTNLPQTHVARNDDKRNIGPERRFAIYEATAIGYTPVSGELIGGQAYTVTYDKNAHTVVKATGFLDGTFLITPEVRYGENGIVTTRLEKMNILSFPVSTIVHIDTNTQVYPRPKKV